MEWESSHVGSSCSVGIRSHHWRGVSASVGHIATVPMKVNSILISSHLVALHFYSYFIHGHIGLDSGSGLRCKLSSTFWFNKKCNTIVYIISIILLLQHTHMLCDVADFVYLYFVA